MFVDRIPESALFRHGMSVGAVLLSALGLILIRDHVNSTTVAMALLIVVLSSATFFGRNPALLASFIAMLCFNYFFLPPYHTWAISDPQNLLAWAAFTITAIIAGELSAYARRRAQESKQLYQELQIAFESATQAEALRRSEQLKSALLDAVSHDLRTPLTSIKASVTTLLESEAGHRTIELDRGERAEFLNIIDEETDRLNRFIEGMIAFARVEAGSALSAGSVASIEDIVSIALARAEGTIGERRLAVNIDDDLPSLPVDTFALAEVMYNLLENAAKYSPADSVITITASVRDNSAVISVNDEGIGIPAEMQKAVLEKFVRLAGEERGGLGLGLAIARGIVEAQNGTIEVRDGKNGKGTSVVLTLPVGAQ